MAFFIVTAVLTQHSMVPKSGSLSGLRSEWKDDSMIQRVLIMILAQANELSMVGRG